MKHKKEKRQKFIVFVTWAVAIIFGITCAGMIVNFGSRKGNPSGKPVPVNSPVDKTQAEVSYWKGKVEESPQDPICLGNLAYSYQQAYKMDEAIKFYEQALKYDPKYIFAINNLAKIYLNTGSVDKAIKAWEGALKIEKKNYEIYLGLALAYMQKKDSMTSKIYLDQLIKVEPGYILAYEIKAEILNKEGDAAGARKILEDAREIAKIKGEADSLTRVNKAIENLNN